MKSTRKYLANYAESEASIAKDLLCTEDTSLWQYCLVIPAYKESEVFYQRLVSSLLKQHAVLLVLVINQPDNLVSTDNSNTRLWRKLIDCTVEQQSWGHLQLRDIPHTRSALLLVDRFSPNRVIPEKQGVGLARKIGADIALSLIDNANITHPWIYTSDADAHLPSNYFTALDNDISIRGQNQSAAAIYPFKHQCDDTPVGQATRLYEQRMYQYVDGLDSAGSPYAFQTIGSTIAVSAGHYAQVRGFPKRSGGEDFYLLNKLAKTGAINKLQAPTIIIEVRQSDRVPFGTGPAISKLLLEKNLNEANIFYHPQIFIELKAWLDAMPASQTNDLGQLNLSTSSLSGLKEIGAIKGIKAARKIATSAQSYEKHMDTWFDAFKTLKFIHYLQENDYPSISASDLKEACQNLGKTSISLFNE